MMSPDDIRQWALRRYKEWLCASVKNEPFFPREVKFGKPSSTADFSHLKASFEVLSKGSERLGYQIQWEHRTTKRWGLQQFPEKVWFEDANAFLRAIGKAEEAKHFQHNLELTTEKCPELLPWLGRQALKMAEAPSIWPKVLAVADYFLKCPEPKLYPRQLPIQVPTKFIDEHHDLLRPILDFLLDDKIDKEAATFNGRYHLLEDEAHVRIRFLDNDFRVASNFPINDITLPASSFRNLGLMASSVIVVENKMCFLTLPTIKGGIAVWGQGKAASLLHQTHWLQSTRVIYWGDMDDSGFGILSALRTEYPHVESMLMNISTWDAFQQLSHKGKIDSATSFTQHLFADEVAAWNKVRSHSQMIEQEQIPMASVVEVIQRMLGGLNLSSSSR